MNQIFLKVAPPPLLPPTTSPHTKATMQGESYHSDLLARLIQEEEGEWSKCLRKPKPGIPIKNVKSSLQHYKARIDPICACTVKDHHLPSKRCPSLTKAMETLRKCSRVWNSVFEFHTCFLLLGPKFNQHLMVLTPTFKPQGSSLLHSRPTDRTWLVHLLICFSLDFCMWV